MREIIETLNRLADQAAPLTVAIFWQSALLAAAAVALIAWALRRASPAVRYWLWQIVALKLLLMPLWTSTLSVGWPVPAALNVMPSARVENAEQAPATNEVLATEVAAVSSQSSPAPATRPSVTNTAPALRLTWTAWLLLVWAAVIAWQLVQLGLQRRRLSQLLRQATTADHDVIALVDQVGRSQSLTTMPTVLVTHESCSPFVQGILRPRLVLPKSLLPTLSREQLRQVISHELAHIRRGDLAWCWIPQVARMLFFFNPVAHLAWQRIRLESELACDQQAMAQAATPTDYVQTLVLVVSHISEPPQLQRNSA